MTDANDRPRNRPADGDSTSPGPVAPDTPPTSSEQGTPPAPSEQAPPPAPGEQDLPWKATAERRDLWGPVEQPLERTVHDPGSNAVGRPRRSSLVAVGLPLLVGGLAGIGAFALGLGAALAAPVIVLGGALGIGVLAAGGSGLALRASRRSRAPQLAAGADVPEHTQQVLATILQATQETRGRVATLRRQASEPRATLALEHVDSQLRRIDALVGSEQIRSQRPSSGEITMLEGMATRYLPELVDAAEDTIGFLATFRGSARQEALDNLESIDQQLAVLDEGIERLEHDIASGVSRSLEVHSEFLRTRFADQHLSPLIDI